MNGSLEPARRQADSSNAKQLDLVPIYDNLRYSILANGSLAIGNATQREQGLYMCAARNGFGPEASKLVRLTVHEPARVPSRYKVVESRIDERGQLTCQASGEPPLAIQWLDKESRPIDSKSTDKRFIIDTAPATSVVAANATLAQIESSLFITRTQRSDSGHFTCVASNKFGQDKLVLQLLVLDVPDRVVELKVTNSTPSSVSLRWQLGFTGNAPVTSYLVQYQSDDPLDDLALGPAGAPPAAGAQLAATSASSGARAASSSAQLLAELQQQVGELSAENRKSAASLRAALELLSAGGPAGAVGVGAAVNQSSAAAANGDEAIDRTLVELTVEQTATSLVVKDLSPYCVYRFRLAGINKVGLGEFTDWIRAKTEEAPPSGSASKMVAVATGPNSVKLSWWPPERRTWNGQLQRFHIGYRPIDSTFELHKSLDWTPPSPVVSDAKRSAQPATGSDELKDPRGQSGAVGAQQQQQQQRELVAHLTNLQRSTTYLVWIQAVNSRGPGPQSHAISVKTLDDVPPSAPALRVQSASSTSITLTWSMLSNFVSAANQYSLFFRRVPPPPLASNSNANHHLQHHHQSARQHHNNEESSSSSLAAAAAAAAAANFEPGPFVERAISSQELLMAASQSHQQQLHSTAELASPNHQPQHQFVYTLEGLECGSAYELYMTTRNSVGKSEPSAVVGARTRGEPPLAPHNKNHLFVRIGASDVLLNLASWSTGGCPLTHLSLRYKQTPTPPSLAPAVSPLQAARGNGSEPGPALGSAATLAPVSASVPAALLANINQWQLRSAGTMTTSSTGTSATSLVGARHLAAPMGHAHGNAAHLLGGDHTLSDAPAAQFVLKNLLPSTGYELEISAHNAAGLTTAAYEFVTAGPNGTRAGYTRREGVFRLDQRGQPLESPSPLEEAERGGETRDDLGPDSRDFFSLHVGGAVVGGQGPLNNQLAPLLLTLLCLACLVVSSTFCYYRLADSWKRRTQATASDSSPPPTSSASSAALGRRHCRRRDSLDADTMRSVCGTDSHLGSSSPKLGRPWPLNLAGATTHAHAHLVDDELATHRPSPSDTETPPHNGGVACPQRQYWGAAKGGHSANGATFAQSVSMKEFNLVPPLGAATLSFGARAHAHRALAAEIVKMGASATMARGRLFEAPAGPHSQQQQHQQQQAIYAPDCHIYGNWQKQKPSGQVYGDSGTCYPSNTGAGDAADQLVQAQGDHETSWSTPANYAVPGYHTQTSVAAGDPINALYQQQIHSEAHQEPLQQQQLPLDSPPAHSDQQQLDSIPYQCANYNETQANFDACIQHLMDQQQQQQQRQYAPLVQHNTNLNPLNQSALSASARNQFAPPPPQSVIDSSSSSSGIGADLSIGAGLHLMDTNNTTSGTTTGKDVSRSTTVTTTTTTGQQPQVHQVNGCQGQLATEARQFCTQMGTN